MWQKDELPLWEEPRSGDPGRHLSMTDGVGLPELRAQLRDVVDAWKEIVHDGHSSADDLWAALEADVQALQVRWRHGAARPGAPAAGEGTAVSTTMQSAKAVNAVLHDADRLHPALRGLEEWRHIRTVREAVGRLWRTLVTKAGESAQRLLGDRRVSEFLRVASIHACERMAQLACQGADSLRRQQAVLPTAETLLALGQAAGEYSTSARRQGGRPTAEALLTPGAAIRTIPAAVPPSVTVDVPGLRRMGEALARPNSTAAQRRSVLPTAAQAKSPRGVPQRSAPAAGEQPLYLRRDGSALRQGHKPGQR